MIGVIGISYKTTGIEERELFSFIPEDSVVFMKHILETNAVSGIILLSTCNRTEIYFQSNKV